MHGRPERKHAAKMTPDHPPLLETRIANREADLLAAQRLRYRVFVEELGAEGVFADHANRLEHDDLDPGSVHLVLIDHSRSEADLDHVVGVYRLLPHSHALHIGRFYCDSEYDLSPLRDSGRNLLELGRSCVDPAYRGGAGMFLMWSALADYVLETGAEILFGVASFHGADPMVLAQPLSWLHHHHLAPPEMRPRAHPAHFQRMDLIAAGELDRRSAMLAMPPLLKAYLRLGCTIGEGAFLDHGFNTTDVLVMVDTARMSARHRSYYTGRQRGHDTAERA